MRKLPSLSKMEHVTSAEFGENMDAIIDRVINEDVALIIDHKGKSYVLCPANWFEYPELKQMELMLKNAVRYVTTVDNTDLAEITQIVKDLAPALSPECIRGLLEMIQDTANSELAELRHILDAALATAEKEKDSDSP